MPGRSKKIYETTTFQQMMSRIWWLGRRATSLHHTYRPSQYWIPDSCISYLSNRFSRLKRQAPIDLQSVIYLFPQGAGLGFEARVGEVELLHFWCWRWVLPKYLLGFRKEYLAAQGWLDTPVPDLALEAWSFVRPDGGARGRRRAGMRDQFLQTR